MVTSIMYFVYGCLCYLLFAGATSAYNVLAIQFEERDLAHKHGPAPAYEEYRRAVPVLIPSSVGALPAPTSTQEAAMP
jgi:protein-S-isoprenylcysteine O-methyltransferase Ste14